MSKECGNCYWFTAGKPFRGYLNPQTVRGDCGWESSYKLPFWLHSKYRPVPLDGEDCETWRPRVDNG